MTINFEGTNLDTLNTLIFYSEIKSILDSSFQIVDIFQNNCELLRFAATGNDHGLMLLLLDYYECNVIQKIKDNQSQEFIEAVTKLVLAVRTAFPDQSTMSEEMLKVVDHCFENKYAERINRLEELAKELLGVGFDYNKNAQKLFKKILDHAAKEDNTDAIEAALSWYSRYILGEIPIKENEKYKEACKTLEDLLLSSFSEAGKFTLKMQDSLNIFYENPDIFMPKAKNTNIDNLSKLQIDTFFPAAELNRSSSDETITTYDGRSQSSSYNSTPTRSFRDSTNDNSWPVITSNSDAQNYNQLHDDLFTFDDIPN